MTFKFEKFPDKLKKATTKFDFCIVFLFWWTTRTLVWNSPRFSVFILAGENPVVFVCRFSFWRSCGGAYREDSRPTSSSVGREEWTRVNIVCSTTSVKITHTGHAYTSITTHTNTFACVWCVCVPSRRLLLYERVKVCAKVRTVE